MTSPQDLSRTGSAGSSGDLLECFGHELATAVVDLTMHEQGSSALQATADRLERYLRTIAAEGLAQGGGGGGEWFAVGNDPSDPGEATLTIDLADGRLRAGGRLLLGASLQAGPLLRAAARGGLEQLVLRLDGPSAVRGEDLVSLVAILIERETPRRPDEWRGALRRRGVRGLQVVVDGRSTTSRASSGEEDRLPTGALDAIDDYQRIAEVLQANHVAAFRGDDLDLDAASGIVERTLLMMQRQPSALLALAQYDDVDRFTVGHSVRVALLALHTAQAAGANREQLLKVGTAALLHDVGKGRISQEVLFKPGALDEDEWREMARHPRLGAELLIEQKTIDPTAVTASFCHHLALDGGGYPKPLIRFRPSSISRLVRVCDTFEALTAVRPYKPAMSPIEAYVVMHRGVGRGLDKDWMDFFIRTVGLYPLGSKIVLEDGSRAVVEGTGPRADAPLVRLLTGPRGARMEADAPRHMVVDGTLAGRRIRFEEERAGVDPAGKPEGVLETLSKHVGGACLPGGAGHAGPPHDHPCGGHDRAPTGT